jgi:hypothetical protein
VNAIPGEIERTAGDLLLSLREYRAAKERYAAAAKGILSTDRDVAAPAQQQIREAMALGQWFQGEVTALGAALTGLCLSQMGEPR